MAKESIQDKRFQFLHSHVAREPHVYEVLGEIMNYQANVLNNGIGHLATMEDLKTSRNIKIPFTIARNKIIANLIDILTKNYPDIVRSIVTFSFSVEPQTKKLSINENREYSVLLSNEEFGRLQSERNIVSSVNFLELISQFRLFNLTKLLKKAKDRTLLSQVIKLELGKSMFTYKNYTVDRQGVELAEDFCFHRINYESVTKMLTLEKINKVILNHSVPILRRLKNFGILNTDFSDYRDTKLDYLLNILLQDIYLSLSDAELTEAKNFNSLRSCILKVDTLIDPLITASSDIASYVRECHLCATTSLTAVVHSITEDQVAQWVEENGQRFRIILFKDEDGITYLIDGTYLLPRLTELHDLIINRPEALVAMSHFEKGKVFDETTLLCNAAPEAPRIRRQAEGHDRPGGRGAKAGNHHPGIRKLPEPACHGNGGRPRRAGGPEAQDLHGGDLRLFPLTLHIPEGRDPSRTGAAGNRAGRGPGLPADRDRRGQEHHLQDKKQHRENRAPLELH